METINNNVTANNNNQEESTMNRSEIVRAYVAANPTPDQNLCPEIIQNWKDSSDTYVYWSNKTGRRTKGTSHPATTDHHYRWPISGYYFGFYVKAVPEYNMLEVSNISMKGNRGLNGEVRDWSYNWYESDRKFIFKGDNSYYTIAGRRQESPNPYYSKMVAETIHTGALNGFFCMYSYKEEIQKLYPDIEDVDHIYQLERFYKNGWVKRKESKVMKNLNEVELDAPDMSKLEDDVHRVHVIEQVNEDYVVIRRFDQNYSWGNDGKSYSDWNETIRVFVSKKGKPTVMTPHYYNHSWRISTARIYSWGDDKVGVIGEEIIDTWLPLKYLKGVIDFKTKECLADLVATMRHPIIEQLIKSGYPKIAEELCRDNQIAANLRDTFRVDKETKQPLYKLLGVNKWLLQAVENYEAPHGVYYSRSKTGIIYQIKWLYNRFDISDLSKETIDLLVFGLSDNINAKELIYGVDFSWRWRNQRWAEVPEEERNFILKLYRMKKKDPEHPILRTYVDTTRLYSRIDNNRRPQVDLKRFGDFNDLVNLHDRLNEIYNIQYTEQQARWDEEKRRRLEAEKELFKKLQKDRKEKFNAESTNYVIRVPEELDEITQEGINLHHCVGGYVDSHAHGNTNIIFLRRKDAPDKSFYTIEVKNDEVIQIHGSHNKWLGNDPEAIPFVWKWIKDRGFHCPDYILLNKGAGYCKGTEALDKSYLTKEVM